MASCGGSYDDGMVRVTCAGSPAVVLIAGEIDESNYSALVGVVAHFADRDGDVHINLAGLTFCDLAGLRAILRLAGTGSGNGHRGRRLVLHDVPGHLTRLLQILGWDSTPGLVTNEGAHLTASPSGVTCAGPASAGEQHLDSDAQTSLEV